LKFASNDAIFDAEKGSRIMRTTVTLDDELVAKAQNYTGIKERATLIRMGLEALVQREAARRLARLGGSDPNATAGRRRRPDDEQE
jgi:Arc/MetJ family transcription regulator